MSKLVIQNFRVSIENKQILFGINLEINESEIHVIMGPNGSGKSTLANSLMGSPFYLPVSAKDSHVRIGSRNILNLKPEERARMGLYVSFQNPPAVPGVSVVNLLREAIKAKTNNGNKNNRKNHNPILAKKYLSESLTYTDFLKMIKENASKISISNELLKRGVNDGFSGGERKKMEMLEALVLKPEFAFFDEIDTGLDVDALKTIATGLKLLNRKGTALVIITHYLRILKYIRPDYVHVMDKGRIVKSGDYSLAKEVEKQGYKNIRNLEIK